MVSQARGGLTSSFSLHIPFKIRWDARGDEQSFTTRFATVRGEAHLIRRGTLLLVVAVLRSVEVCARMWDFVCWTLKRGLEITVRARSFVSHLKSICWARKFGRLCKEIEVEGVRDRSVWNVTGALLPVPIVADLLLCFCSCCCCCAFVMKLKAVPLWTVNEKVKKFMKFRFPFPNFYSSRIKLWIRFGPRWRFIRLRKRKMLWMSVWPRESRPYMPMLKV